MPDASAAAARRPVLSCLFLSTLYPYLSRYRQQRRRQHAIGSAGTERRRTAAAAAVPYGCMDGCMDGWDYGKDDDGGRIAG